MDAETNEKLFELTDGYVLDKSQLPPFSIQAMVERSRHVKSLVFAVDGKVTKMERHEPYTIAGESAGGILNPWSVDAGQDVITATPYERLRGKSSGRHSRRDWREIRGKSLSLSISVISPGVDVPPAEELPRVVNLVLIDTRRGDNLLTLSNETVVDKSVLPQFTVRAVTRPTQIGSVVFWVNDKVEKTENFEPYVIAGDVRGQRYHRWPIGRGEYNITAVPFAEKNGRGMEGKAVSAMITVV